MKFLELSISGCYEIQREFHKDERGFFGRFFCEDTLKKRGLLYSFSQQSISYNKKMWTVRGMHYQISPYEEVKIVTCIKGEAFDVVVDLRKDSPSYGQHLSIILSEKAYNSVYIPKGCAHGFQTLRDDCLLHYMMDTPYVPKSASGFWWLDSKLNIDWPLKEETKVTISNKDKQLATYF